MLLVKNLPFSNVGNNGVASVSLPIGMSYNRILLKLGTVAGAEGEFSKSMITNIKVRVNGKCIFENTASRLDAQNKYRGIASDDNFLTIDFTEPRARSMAEQFIGNINTAQGVSSVTMEITITGALNPTLESWSELGPPAPLGVIAKQIPFTASFGASGKFPFRLIDAANKGAIIKRVHFAHGGNMESLEVKKNGIVIHDSVPVDVNAFYQSEYKKAPQGSLYTYDPCCDDNYANSVKTADMVSLEFNPIFSAADTVTAVIEVLDVIGNM